VCTTAPWSARWRRENAGRRLAVCTVAADRGRAQAPTGRVDQLARAAGATSRHSVSGPTKVQSGTFGSGRAGPARSPRPPRARPTHPRAGSARGRWWRTRRGRHGRSTRRPAAEPLGVPTRHRADPAPDRGQRPAGVSGDAAVARAARADQQRHTDHGGRVGPPRQQLPGQQHLGRSAAAKRARRDRTCSVVEPCTQTRRARPCPHRRSIPPHCGHGRLPAVRSASARSWSTIPITEASSRHSARAWSTRSGRARGHVVLVASGHDCLHCGHHIEALLRHADRYRGRRNARCTPRAGRCAAVRPGRRPGPGSRASRHAQRAGCAEHLL